MALIICSECGKQISDKAQHCVHCGAPVEHHNLSTMIPSGDQEMPSADLVAPVNQLVHPKNSDRFYGRIENIKTYMVDGQSLAEVIILTSNGSTISTGSKSAKEIRPFIWSKGDEVSFVREDGYASDVLKESKVFTSEKFAKHETSTSHPRQAAGNITRNYLWFLVLVLLAVGYWISKGTPSVDLIFSDSLARDECVRLANENKGSMMILADVDIIANDSWLKDGKRVVQLTQTNNDGIRTIMCLYGNGMVSIPSMLEQGRWR
jgi:hypothetical protein